MTPRDQSTSRRRLLATAGASTLVALAGCTSTVRENTRFLGEDTDDELHKHGYLFVEVDGETIDFGRDRYHQGENDEVSDDFHFHDYDEDHRWHMHRQRFTLGGAISTLPGFDHAVEGGADVLTVEGETYTDGEDATITATEREEGEIEIDAHELHGGDIVEITVETE